MFSSQVFDRLKDIHNIVRKTSSSPLPRPPPPLDSSVGALSQQLSKLGPLEDTYQLPQSSQFSSSSSSSSFCALTPPNPLHSASSFPPSSSSSSFAGPCETDESRGFSQYDPRAQVRSNGTSCPSAPTRDQNHSSAAPGGSQSSQPSVPTEDQYNFPPQPSSTSDRSGAGVLTGAPTGPDTRGQTTAGPYGVPQCLSVGSLRSVSPGPSGTSTAL